jgi:hypothetical protein
MSSDAPWFAALGVVLPVVCGGVHLTAWNFEFPSFAEEQCWRVMCLVIMCALLVLIAVAWILDKIEGRLPGCFTVMVATYKAARLYIVAEAFISLGSVSIGFYCAPSWLRMLPHV